MSPPARTNLRKVQPFLLPHAIAQALEATARSMASPMMPHVSLAAAARDVIDKGLASLDALLRSGEAVVWAAVDPPRGARRREAAVSPNDARVRDATYVQVSPLALSEESIARLEDVRRRLSTATGAKVSTVKVLRESLARGLEVRERTQTGVEALLQKYAAEFARFGIGATAQFTVVASGVTQKYAPPPGGADAWSRPARAPTSKRKAPAAPKAAVTTTTAKRPRSRSRRQQAAVRREPSGDDDGGDGEPAPAPREPSHACAKAGSGSAGPTPIAAARGTSELSTVDPAWRASARTALARLFLAALRRA